VRFLQLRRDTRTNIAVIGIGSVAVFGLLSALMFAFREVFEPVLPYALRLLARVTGARVSAGYEPADYYFWASMPLLFGATIFTVAACAWWLKPRVDRRIDANIRARLQESARGAPLE